MTEAGSGGAPQKNPHAAARVYDGQAFIVVPQTTRYEILNGVGSRVWDLIDGRRSVGEIAGIIAEEFEVSLEDATKDVDGFLGELKEHGMLATGG
ncbi:MAG: PqqD family protein [Candidatus Polarisedimenticolia bacterium]